LKRRTERTEISPFVVVGEPNAKRLMPFFLPKLGRRYDFALPRRTST
jgi:hypothetical protein